MKAVIGSTVLAITAAWFYAVQDMVQFAFDTNQVLAFATLVTGPPFALLLVIWNYMIKRFDRVHDKIDVMEKQINKRIDDLCS